VCGSSPQVAIEVMVSLILLQAIVKYIEHMNQCVWNLIALTYSTVTNLEADALYTKVYAKSKRTNNYVQSAS